MRCFLFRCDSVQENPLVPREKACLRMARERVKAKEGRMQATGRVDGSIFFCHLKQFQTYNDNDPKHVIVIAFFLRYVTLLHLSTIDVITICEILCQLCLPVVGLSKTLDIKHVDLWSWRHSQRHPSPVGRTGHLSKWPNYFRLLKYFMRLPRIDMKATKFGFIEKSKIQKNRRQMEQRIAGIVCATHLSVHPTLIWFRKKSTSPTGKRILSRQALRVSKERRETWGLVVTVWDKLAAKNHPRWGFVFSAWPVGPAGPASGFLPPGGLFFFLSLPAISRLRWILDM